MQWNDIERLWGETAQRMQPGYGAAPSSPFSGFAATGDGLEEEALPLATQVQASESSSHRFLAGW